MTKCRNAYIAARNSDDQDIEMFACKYNDLHHVPYIELRWHQERCPFRQEGFFHGGDAQIPMNPKVGLGMSKFCYKVSVSNSLESMKRRAKDTGDNERSRTGQCSLGIPREIL